MAAADVLAPALAELLTPLNIELQADAGQLPEIDPTAAGAAQLVAVSIEPTALQGRWLTTWELWVCAPSLDPQQAEDELDELLPAVVGALESVGWVTWQRATRDTHPNNHAAWRLELQTLT